MEHFFPKRGVYGFARTDGHVRVVTLVNAASEARPLPWDNLEAWLDGATRVEELQRDGSSKTIDVRSIDQLESWAHKVWVVRR